MDAYPVAALANSISGITQTNTPTPDQLADADIVLTATFAALGEDYLTGQVDPKSVAQNWHIDPQEENVDSALARGDSTAVTVTFARAGDVSGWAHVITYADVDSLILR